MAASLALIPAVLLSQIATSMAATSPWTIELACSHYTNGCTCDAVGLVDNKSAANVVYTSDREGACCQFVTPTKNCREWLSNGTGCGTKMINLNALKTAAGTTPSTTCCKDPPNVTCADVTCTASRRRSAGMWKAKANVASTTACTSEKDCENKCCEKDMTTCMFAAESSGNSSGYSCGAGKIPKVMESHTCSNGEHTSSISETASMKVSDEAGYRSTCCQNKSSCPSSPSCPSHKVKSNHTTTYTSSEEECCTYKATSCMRAGGTCSEWSSQGGDSCGVGAVTVCTSTLCNDTNLVLDTTKEFALGDNDAQKKTKCCIAKATSSGTTCGAWTAAAAQEAATKATKGSTNGAHVKSASLAVLLLGAFAVRFGL